MPHLTTDDGVKLYYEDAGSGAPIVFVHEFAGDYRTWEPQMRHFSRAHTEPDAFNAALAELFAAAESGRWLAHKPG